MSNKESNSKIWDLISSIKIGMLTTENQSELRSRPMQLVQKEYDGTLWFYTSTKSSKVEEIEKEHSVCLTFTCPDRNIYVSLSGTAAVSRDQGLIDKFWNSFVSAWFPDGKDSPNCALLEVNITHGETWESDLNSLEYLYEIGKSNLTGTTPASNRLIQNEKF